MALSQHSLVSFGFIYGYFLLILLEPVGSVLPTFNAADKLNFQSVKGKHFVTLLCPAQSYPVPTFR